MVLDFDWSLVEENSDTWVLDQLGASHIFQRLLSQGMHVAPRTSAKASLMTLG